VRTRLHFFGERPGVELARHERALDVLLETAHRDRLRVRDPCRAPRLGVRQCEHGNQRVCLHPRQAAARERGLQLGRVRTRPLEPQQRLRLARRHPKPFAREDRQTRAASEPVAARLRDLVQQRAHLGHPPLLDPQRAP